jgi:hypothetical protein
MSAISNLFPVRYSPSTLDRTQTQDVHHELRSTLIPGFSPAAEFV